jgi:hypothetical protein
MTLNEFREEFEEFVEDKEFLNNDDGDPDEYRRGYRRGYFDALRYVQDWLDEEAGVDETGL